MGRLPFFRIKLMNPRLLLLFSIPFLYACSEPAIDKSETKAKLATEVTALRETVAVDVNDDAADDPAIWVHPGVPGKSLVLGTNKKKGLEVYDLDGRRIQLLSTGRVNNVDVRQDIKIGSELMDLAIATNRTSNMLDVYRIFGNEQRVELVEEMSIQLEISEPYGTCLYQPDDTEGVQIFVNSKDGIYQHWLLSGSSSLLGEFSLESQPEGCVADDEGQVLYAGEEDRGFWKVDLSSRDYQRKLVDTTGTERLTADVEGITLYKSGAEKGYIIVSSQGNNTYAVYQREADNKYIGSFSVVDDTTANIDGTSETDGISASSQLKTPTFPEGLLVIQDGYNTLPDQHQDFKYVSWRDIREALGLNP